MFVVNGMILNDYGTAVETAKAAGAEVFEVRPDGERIRRWTPAQPRKRRVQHFYVGADRKVIAFSRVRQ